MTDRYYTIDVAAVAAGTTPQQIERWIKQGVIKPLDAGGVTYVTVEAVKAAPEKAKRHGYARLARSLTHEES